LVQETRSDEKMTDKLWFDGQATNTFIFTEADSTQLAKIIAFAEQNGFSVSPVKERFYFQMMRK
jgi:hypothetical protein